VLDYAVLVSFDCVIYCAFYSILFRGAVFSRTRCMYQYCILWKACSYGTCILYKICVHIELWIM